jgi:hypothetical protein
MGTTRAHKHQRHADAQKLKAKQRQHRRARGPSAKAPLPLLYKKLPRAGLIYPFSGSFMRRQRGDIGVWSAIKKTIPSITTATLDTIFSRIFEEATIMLQEDKDKQLPRNPLEFMKILRKRPSLREPWLSRQAHFLLTVFIILRAARGNWHKTPRPPTDIDKHCKTALAIDAFLEAEDFYWSSLSTVEWFVNEKGGLDLIRPVWEDDSEEGEGQDDNEEIWDGEKISDDDMFVEEVASASEEPGGPPKISLEQLVEGMRRLNIEVNKTALTDAFAKLCVNEEAGAVAAPDRAGSPLLDDSDEDVVL